MVAYDLMFTMQSALPLPPAVRVPPAPLRSGVSHVSEPVTLRPSIVQQKASQGLSQAPLQDPSSTSRATAPRSPLHARTAQQPLRPVRPAWEAAPLSPTRQLLSEPQTSLHEVLRSSAKLGGSQQAGSQTLLAAVAQSLKSNRQPSHISSQLAAALSQAAATAAVVEKGQQPQQPATAAALQQQQQRRQQVSMATPELQPPQTSDVTVQQQQQQQTVKQGSVPPDSLHLKQQQLQQPQGAVASQQQLGVRSQTSQAVATPSQNSQQLQHQQQLWPSQLQQPQWQQPQVHVPKLQSQQQAQVQAVAYEHAAQLMQQDQWSPLQEQQQQECEEAAGYEAAANQLHTNPDAQVVALFSDASAALQLQ